MVAEQVVVRTHVQQRVQPPDIDTDGALADYRAAIAQGSEPAAAHRGIGLILRLRGETFGVALASSHTRGYFTEDDINRFQIFADPTSAILARTSGLVGPLLRRQLDRTAGRVGRRA